MMVFTLNVSVLKNATSEENANADVMCIKELSHVTSAFAFSFDL